MRAAISVRVITPTLCYSNSSLRSSCRGKRAFLLKVPKAGGAKKGRSLARKCKDKTVDAFNRLVTEITENNPWVNSLNYEVNDAEGIKPIFEGDGTHCNTRVAEVVGRIMKDLI